MQDNGIIRQSATGATRDSAKGKPQYNRFLCPIVLQYYCERYMLPNQVQSNGALRAADNWKNGFGLDDREQPIVFDSLDRHFHAVWRKVALGEYDEEEMLQDLCGVLFNTMAMMREILIYGK